MKALNGCIAIVILITLTCSRPAFSIEVRPDSKIAMTLKREGGLGGGPCYSVTISTDGIIFKSRYGTVVGISEHKQSVDAAQVRNLAKRFVDAGFYSIQHISIPLDALGNDDTVYELSVEIDGHWKKVVDRLGLRQETGYAAIVEELENEIDKFAKAEIWVEGAEGLVAALRTEKFNFQSREAQVILENVISNGNTTSVREFLEAGVPLTPLPIPQTKESTTHYTSNNLAWLVAAAPHPETLKLLIRAGVGRNDQNEKNWALVNAVLHGRVTAARDLIAYGAEPNLNFSKLKWSEDFPADGSLLIKAAQSGNPEMVREILRYKPELEKRDNEGKTALLWVGKKSYAEEKEEYDGAFIECLRLLAKAGANVNARDENGNTPLHDPASADFAAELLKLGANVNARNYDGQTPLHRAVEDVSYEVVKLLLSKGAETNAQDKNGRTPMSLAAKYKDIVQLLRQHGSHE
jgi:ankyrin repeat protein